MDVRVTFCGRGISNLIFISISFKTEDIKELVRISKVDEDAFFKHTQYYI